MNEIDENQVALIRAVARIAECGEELLLDGHFVLRSGPFVHRRLDKQVFRNLQCAHIIILTALDSIVLSRLKGRGDETWTLEEVAAFSKAEVEHGKTVAANLGISAIVLDSPNADALAEAIGTTYG